VDTDRHDSHHGTKAGVEPLENTLSTHSNIAERLPGVGRVVRASDRAYSAYLNRLRADVFDSTAAAFERGGITPATHPETLRLLGRYINAATGRGDLGALEKAAPALSQALFSPRFQASRFQLLNPVEYARMDPAVRGVALRDMAALTGAQLSLLGLAKMGGAEVSLDPRATDFARIKVGQTRIDPVGAGFLPWLRLYAQMTSGEKTTSGGHHKTLGDTSDPHPETRLDVVGKFAEGRLAPVPGLFVEALRGTTFAGKPFNPTDSATARLLPLLWQDFSGAVREHGLAKGSALAAPAVLGSGVTTYEKDDRPAARVRRVRRVDEEE